MQNFLQWRVLLDITLITLLLYSFYRTLRATGAWKIALGLTFAAGVALVARLLGLQGFEWIFSNFSQIAVLALLIIFQPEIRRILERTFFLGHHHRRAEKKTETAEIIDQALFDLAERRWGALLVFPGEVPLQQWITEGVLLDALAGPQLLLSLFDTSSPGHDGAVIIQGERIDRFGVHLPLSVSNRLSKDLGTRHHAAMGLAEKTDALVFAVSEERGTVSAFLDGEMVRLTSRGDVARLIAEHARRLETFAGTVVAKKQNSLRTIAEIGASFSLAVLLWLTLIQSGTEIREMLFTVPIEYSKASKNIELIGKQEEVKLLMEGPLATLRGVDPYQLRVQVDVSQLGPGRHRIDLSDATIVVPNKLRLLDIQPANFEVKIKKVEARKVPVSPQFIGTLPAGYRIGAMEIIPAAITIENAGHIDSLTTQPIYLSGLAESTTVQSRLVVPEQLQEEGKNWPEVSVKLTIVKDRK
ncbi:MAG: diadenylate cyclase [Thermodesulfobacteriota bacterium]